MFIFFIFSWVSTSCSRTPTIPPMHTWFVVKDDIHNIFGVQNVDGCQRDEMSSMMVIFKRMLHEGIHETMWKYSCFRGVVINHLQNWIQELQKSKNTWVNFEHMTSTSEMMTHKWHNTYSSIGSNQCVIDISHMCTLTFTNSWWWSIEVNLVGFH